MLTSFEGTLGVEHPDTLKTLNNLAGVYKAQGRFDEAEALVKRALAAYERVLGREHPSTLATLNNLALLYNQQGRYGEAEPLFKRVAEAYGHTLGPEHPDTLSSLDNLAQLYDIQGRYGEAEPLYTRVLAARERTLGSEHPGTIGSLNGLALLYEGQGRYDEAERLYKHASAAAERALGPQHGLTLGTLSNLAALYLAQGRYREAEPLFKRTLAARERALGPGHPETLASLNNSAAFYLTQGNWPQAVQFWQRSTGAIIQRLQSGTLDAGQVLTVERKNGRGRATWHFRGLLKAAYRLAPEGHTPDAGLTAEAFQSAQWALSSSAAQALAQMAVRGAKGKPGISALVRERQDLVTEWEKRDELRAAALAQPPEKRNAQAEGENQARIAAIDARIAEIGKRLQAEFPDYASLTSAAALSAEDVQALLSENEALVFFFDTAEWKPLPEETFIWAVTKTGVRWARSGLGTASLSRSVEALRCGLDASTWEGAGWQKCRELTQAEPARDTNGNVVPATLPFGQARAHELYQALFGPVADLIKDKQLLLVPSGPLTQLPFQVLVTAEFCGRRREIHSVAHPRACSNRAARSLFAQGAAAAGTARRGEQTHDRLR